MTDGGRLRDPGQQTTKAAAARPHDEPAEPHDPARADAGGVRRGGPPLTPSALPDPGQDSTQHR